MLLQWLRSVYTTIFLLIVPANLRFLVSNWYRSAYFWILTIVLGFTKADGMRYGRDHIRVNAVCPGVIKTPLLGNISDDDTTSIGEMTKEMALGRQGRPEEVAEALYWLTSPQSSFVTGIALPVNGGKSLDLSALHALKLIFRAGMVGA